MQVSETSSKERDAGGVRVQMPVPCSKGLGERAFSLRSNLLKFK